MKSLYVILAGAVALTSPLFARGEKEPPPEEVTVGHYASVNGLNLYYEVHGEGEPLVLLHGAYCTIEACLTPFVQAFAKTHMVIVPELQGHGRTADIDRPISVAAMASDVVALLDELDLDRADVVGYSMGGGVAIELAISHPTRVHRVVPISTSMSNEGLYPELLSMIEVMTPEGFIGTPWQDAYVAVAPDPSAFPELVSKLQAFTLGFEGWSPEALSSSAVPMLFVIGDVDIIQPKHAVEMFTLVGGGVSGDMVERPSSQLAVIPGASHVGILQQAELVAQLAVSFLTAE